MTHPSSPKQPDVESYNSPLDIQTKWYLKVLSIYFSDSKDLKRLKEIKTLKDINQFTKAFGFPELEYITSDMSIEKKTQVMKNLFHFIMKVYEKIESKYKVDLSQFKNHARVLEQFEDMPQYLMKKIAEDFQTIQKDYPKINLPEIPYQTWPNS